MKIIELVIEYRKEAIGLDIEKPRFSWKLQSSEQDITQTFYRVTVSNNNLVVWDSKKIKSNESLHITYEGIPLEPRSKYSVNVEVWNNKGNYDSKKEDFETGLFGGENFQAKMIASPSSTEEAAPPVFTKEFSIKKEVEKVRIYATALGVYEIKVNGIKAGDSFFSPGWTNYHERLQYQTYKADDLISDNHNKIEITVGNGWYKGMLGFDAAPNHYGNRVAVIAEIHITYTDGTSELIATDESWEVKTGEIRSSEFYMGETIDSTFHDHRVSSAVPVSFDKGRIISQESETVKITQRLPAKEFILSPKGEKVIDFGQNIAGFVELKVKGEPGQKITIRHAETLDKDGNFYTENLRKAKSTDYFICNGEEQVFLPHFTFHGFRYIAIEGIEEINLENFTACVLQTDVEETGKITTSNSEVNQLFNNIQWSQRGNFIDVPTDCPQRDERMGWTGDAQIFSGTATFNSNVALFFKKWLRDLASEQTRDDGVPRVVPNILGSDDGPAAAWSDAAVIIPWVLYQTYGDIKILEEQYSSMKDWIDYVTEQSGSNGLWQTGFQYGDWLSLAKEEGSPDFSSLTDKYLVANAYYIYSTGILIKVAKALNNQTDVNTYSQLYNRIKKSFNEEYFTKNGRLINDTQTAYILAIHFDLVAEKHKNQILNSLKDNIVRHNHHLTTGFVGTPYLNHVLSENDMHDIAGEIFMKEDYPSWLYPVSKGATTIWERWDSILPSGDFDSSGMNSLNHYAYGAIGEWMYRKLAGINQLEPGYKKIMIKPKFVKGIHSLESEYESMHGLIKSSWSCIDKKIEIDVEIPANTTAILYLPEKNNPIEVGSGTYHFAYETDTDLTRDAYSFDLTLGEIMSETLAQELLDQHAPGVSNQSTFQNVYHYTINEIIAFSSDSESLFQLIVDTLNRKNKK